jgi:hypothetical protein
MIYGDILCRLVRRRIEDCVVKGCLLNDGALLIETLSLTCMDVIFKH